MEHDEESRIQGMMAKQLSRIAELEQENKLLKSQNSRLEEKLNAALDGTGLCLWEQHIPTGKLTIFNMEWGKMLGFHPNELEATVEVWKSKLHPEDKDEVIESLESHLIGKSESYQAVHRMLHKEGSDSWVSDRGRIVEYDSDGLPLRMMGTHIDITQEKRYEQALAQLASLDPLTNLLNRKTLEEKFKHYRQHHSDSSSALVFIDVDNFKAVNDQLGHKAGDSVLIQIAEWLIEDAPEESLISRLGGDEFVLFVPRADEQMVSNYSQKCLSRVENPIQLENGRAQIGLSIGICLLDSSSTSFEHVYERADKAMYQVKKQGKNGYSFWNDNISIHINA